MKTFAKKRSPSVGTSPLSSQNDPKSPAKTNAQLLSQPQTSFDDIDAEQLIEELDEEGFPGASPSRPAAGNLDKHRRHPAAARRDSGPTDPSKSPACNSLAPNGHRSPSSRQLGQLSGAQVKASPLGSEKLLGQADAVPGDAFEFPTSSPEQEASPLRPRVVALPPPRKQPASTDSPSKRAPSSAAPPGPCLQPSPSVGAAGSPLLTPSQPRRALLPPRPNAAADGSHAKEPVTGSVEVDTPTRHLAKRQAMGTGSSPHRGPISPPPAAANGAVTRTQPPILPGSPFASSSPAAASTRQATPLQGRQVTGASQRGASPQVPGPAQQRPLGQAAASSGRAQSAPTGGRAASGAAPLLPPGVPGLLRSAPSADTAMGPGASAAGNRGAAGAGNRTTAAGSQAAAGTGRVRFGADVILPPPSGAGTRTGAPPAPSSAAKATPSSTSNGSSGSGRSSGGGAGMALQMSAGQYNQLRSMALQQQGRGQPAMGRPAQRAPAQTVMEAQERGELQQLQDTAMYALDGLIPSASRPTQRTSALSLLEILVTRKGRAALRAEGVAQQVLSSLAKLRGCKDPVLALVVAGTLLALACEDAHPSYLASQAACVLMSQLLQVDHDFSDPDALYMPPPASGVNPAQANPAPISSEPVASKANAAAVKDMYEVMDEDEDEDGIGSSKHEKSTHKGDSRAPAGSTERDPAEGDLDLDPGGSRASTMPPEARQAASQLRRALKLITEGQMGRQWAPQLGAAGTPLCSHLPLLMLALGVATSAEPARVHFAVKVKETIRKVGVLGRLSDLVPRCAAQVAAASTQLFGRCTTAAGATEAVHTDAGCLAHAQPQKVMSGLLQELVLVLKVMENSSFTCVENEEALLQARVPLTSNPDLSSSGSGQRGPRAARLGMQPGNTVESDNDSEQDGNHSRNSKKKSEQEQGPTQSLLACLLHLIRQLSGLLVGCDAIRGGPTGDSGPQGAGGAAEAAAAMTASEAEELSAGCSACLHSCLAVLMNLTHKHSEAAAVLAGEGGLETVASLLACCAAVQCSPGTGSAQRTQGDGLKGTAAAKHRDQQQQSSGTPSRSTLLKSKKQPQHATQADAVGTAGHMTVAEAEAQVGCQVVAERGSVLRLMEVLTVGLGLLVNLTSDSPPNRERLRGAVLEARLSQDGPPGNKGAAADPSRGNQNAAAAADKTAPASAEKRKRAQAGSTGAVLQSSQAGQQDGEVDDDDEVPSARPAHKRRRLAASATRHSSASSPGGHGMGPSDNTSSPVPSRSPLSGKAAAKGSSVLAVADASSGTLSSGVRAIPLLCAIISSMMSGGDTTRNKGSTDGDAAGAAGANVQLGSQSQGPAELAGVITGSPQQNLRPMGSGSQQQDLSSWGAPPATRTFTRGGRRGPRASGGAGEGAGKSQASQQVPGAGLQSQGEGYRETQASQSPGGPALTLVEGRDTTDAPGDAAAAGGAAVRSKHQPVPGVEHDGKSLVKPRPAPSSSSSSDGEEEVGRGGVVELTEEQLRDQAAGGEASIVQVYASLLLGFLIQDSEKDRSAAAALLPGGSLLPVLSSIQHMLLFYVQAGAITESTRDSLVSLLQILEPAVLGTSSEKEEVKAGDVLEECDVPTA